MISFVNKKGGLTTKEESYEPPQYIGDTFKPLKLQISCYVLCLSIALDIKNK